MTRSQQILEKIIYQKQSQADMFKEQNQNEVLNKNDDYNCVIAGKVGFKPFVLCDPSLINVELLQQKTLQNYKNQKQKHKNQNKIITKNKFILSENKSNTLIEIIKHYQYLLEKQNKEQIDINSQIIQYQRNQISQIIDRLKNYQANQMTQNQQEEKQINLNVQEAISQLQISGDKQLDQNNSESSAQLINEIDSIFNSSNIYNKQCSNSQSQTNQSQAHIADYHNQQILSNNLASANQFVVQNNLDSIPISNLVNNEVDKELILTKQQKNELAASQGEQQQNLINLPNKQKSNDINFGNNQISNQIEINQMPDQKKKSCISKVNNKLELEEKTNKNTINQKNHKQATQVINIEDFKSDDSNQSSDQIEKEEQNENYQQQNQQFMTSVAQNGVQQQLFNFPQLQQLIMLQRQQQQEFMLQTFANAFPIIKQLQNNNNQQQVITNLEVIRKALLLKQTEKNQQKIIKAIKQEKTQQQ